MTTPAVKPISSVGMCRHAALTKRDNGMSVPLDWYREAQPMLEGRTTLSRKIPIDPNHRLARPAEIVYREE